MNGWSTASLFDPFDAGPAERAHGERRGILTSIIAAGAAFLGATLLLLAALTVVAPAELESLRVSNVELWRSAVSGHFPLIEIADREGRASLAIAASLQTFAGFAFLLATAVFFARRGFVSERVRGWSHGFWIAGICLLCFAPAMFPGVTVQTIDYAVMSSPYPDSAWRKCRRQAADCVPRNVFDEVKQSLSPRVAFAERGVFVALLSAVLALCLHDAGYRAREAMEEFGLCEESVRAARRDEPNFSTRARGWRDARATAEAPGFGHDFGSGGASFHASEPISAEAEARATLGVGAGASPREIQRAYRQQMKRAHPDHGGSVERASAINLARDALLRRG